MIILLFDFNKYLLIANCTDKKDMEMNKICFSVILKKFRDINTQTNNITDNNLKGGAITVSGKPEVRVLAKSNLSWFSNEQGRGR